MNGSKRWGLVVAGLGLSVGAVGASISLGHVVAWRSYEALGLALAVAHVVAAIALLRWFRRELVLLGLGSRLVPAACSERAVEVLPTSPSRR